MKYYFFFTFLYIILCINILILNILCFVISQLFEMTQLRNLFFQTGLWICPWVTGEEEARAPTALPRSKLRVPDQVSVKARTPHLLCAVCIRSVLN